MQFDLRVRCVLQDVLLFRETFHYLVVLPLGETFRFACFAINRNAKQTKHVAKRSPFPMFRIFAKQKSTSSSKTLVWKFEVNRSISFLLLFREMFRISLFRETDVK
jgi:hypothetical protein